MPKTDKNTEIPASTRHVLETAKTRIRSVQLKRDVSQEEKKKRVSETALEVLRKIGTFYQTKAPAFYYFDSIQKRIFKIRDNEFKYLLNQYFEINGSTDYYKYLIEELSSYVSKYAEEVKIRTFSHYDQKNNVLYVHNNGSKIVRIAEGGIAEVENGHAGIIFESKPSFEEWHLADLSEDGRGTAGKSDLIGMLGIINFDTESKIPKECYLWLLEYYIYALFFPNVLNTRPIVAFIGNKGSGKSFFLKLLLHVFYGKEASLSNLPGNDEEFKNSLMNNYLYFIDNLDDGISKSKIDILCSVSTGVGIKKRILYTDSGELNCKVNSFIAITSRTPKFKRVDLNERLLIFKLESLENYVSETELFARVDRNEAMTAIVRKLQALLSGMGKFRYHPTKFRLADFSNLVINLNSGNKTPDEVAEILELFTREQEEFSMETDPLIELLERIVEKSEKPISLTASELHKSLKEQSNLTYLGGERIPYGISNPIALGKKLSEIRKGLSHKFDFRIEPGSSNVKRYVFEGTRTE